jgi:hypothetical protein
MDPISEAYANNRQGYQGPGDLYQAEKDAGGYMGAGDRMARDKELERLKARRAELAARLESLRAAKGQAQQNAAIRAKSYGIDTSSYDSAQNREMQGKRMEYDIKRQDEKDVLGAYNTATLTARVERGRVAELLRSGKDDPAVKDGIEEARAKAQSYEKQAQQLREKGIAMGIPGAYFVEQAAEGGGQEYLDIDDAKKAEIAKNFMSANTGEPSTAALTTYLSALYGDSKIKSSTFNEIFSHANSIYGAGARTADRKEQKADEEFARKETAWKNKYPNFANEKSVQTMGRATMATAESLIKSGMYEAAIKALNATAEEAKVKFGVSIPVFNIKLGSEVSANEAVAQLTAFGKKIQVITENVNEAEKSMPRR